MPTTMPSTRLDRTRPYAEVCGGAATHRFEQEDGVRFDALGNPIAEVAEITEPMTLVESPEITEPQPDDGVAEALAAADDAIEKAKAVVASKKRKR